MPNEVDDWFAAKHHPQEEPMQRVCELILATDPRVTETIEWQTPTVDRDGGRLRWSGPTAT